MAYFVLSLELTKTLTSLGGYHGVLRSTNSIDITKTMITFNGANNNSKMVCTFVFKCNTFFGCVLWTQTLQERIGYL